MKSKSDAYLLMVAAFAGAMLLMVFAGESIPIVFRAIVLAICVVGVIGILVVRNLFPGVRTALLRKLFAAGFVVYGMILISIILFDRSFAPGDSLWLGMERATALLVFGVTFFPFTFTFLWVIGFERAVVTPEKEQHLRRLTEDRKEDKTDG